MKLSSQTEQNSEPYGSVDYANDEISHAPWSGDIHQAEVGDLHHSLLSGQFGEYRVQWPLRLLVNLYFSPFRIQAWPDATDVMSGTKTHRSICRSLQRKTADSWLRAPHRDTMGRPTSLPAPAFIHPARQLLLPACCAVPGRFWCQTSVSGTSRSNLRRYFLGSAGVRQWPHRLSCMMSVILELVRIRTCSLQYGG